MKHLPILLFLGFATMVYTACSDDDDKWADNYEFEYVDLLTDAEGTARRLITDLGEQLTVTNPPQNLKPDTTYRYVVSYVRGEDGVRLTGAARILCGDPGSLSNGAEMRTDSVKVQSLWRARQYVNITLQYRVKEQQHLFAFINDSLYIYPDGHRVLHISLYHNAKDDYPAFYHTGYFSCRLSQLGDIIEEGRDSIQFHINEYGRGLTVHSVAF